LLQTIKFQICNMKKSKWFIIVYAMSIAAIPYGCSPAQAGSGANLDEAKKAIAESNGIYFQAFAKNDSSIFINRYAADCWIMPPDAPPLCGPTAALDFFKTAYNQFGLRNGKFITIDVYGVSDEIVAEIGYWKSYNAANTQFDDGKFLVLWKKTPDGWKMWRDFFSSNHKK